jgi:hypothetical protein
LYFLPTYENNNLRVDLLMDTGPKDTSPASGTIGLPAPASCVPIIPHTSTLPEKGSRESPSQRKNHTRPAARREHALNRDMFFEVFYDGANHIISENYSYKSESYYTILQQELEGKPVRPASSAVLDAYVVPICLERAHLAKIPVCDWGISQGYTPLPSVLYGLNYFADSSEYCVVSGEDAAKEAIRHITNKGKYPFCYQKLDPGSEITSCISVFGKTAGKCRAVEHLAQRVYDLFALPLVTIVAVTDGTTHRLSSLSPTRYSRMSDGERALLFAYMNHQEFL